MEAHARFSFPWTCAAIAMICCCIAGIMGEIKDGFVYTDLLKNVRRGDKTSLKCEFLGAPVAVYWKKGNDPEQSPTLITWMDGRKWQGACAEDDWCDIDENFYLIIKNVTIADTGRYICRVSDYLGRLIHNITDLHVFEPPEEPYPVIKECNDSSALGKDYACVIRSPTPINLTCSASGFFPELNLFFLHGSERIPSVEIQEWTKEDGTRSRSVSISTVPHVTPYVCVASDVPGNQKERAVTVFVSPNQEDISTASTGSTAKPPKEMNVVIITVPVGFVTVVAVCMLIVCWRKHHKKDRRNDHHDAEEGFPLIEERTLTGKFSFYELWIVVSKVTSSDMEKLYETLEELDIPITGRRQEITQRKAYEYLCKWKTDCADDNQSQILQSAMEKSGYSAAWKEICDLGRKQELMVSEGTLEHILWEIGDVAKIHSFLSKLIPDRIASDFEVIGDISSELVQETLGELKEWSKASFDVHPFVPLSLALESTGCCPVDRLFFVENDSFIACEEINYFVKKLTGRHCERLSNLVRLTTHEIATIVDENNRALFDTESMIDDWVAQQNCSHAETRFKLGQAAINIGRQDLKGHFIVYEDSMKYLDTGLEKCTKVEKSKGAQQNVDSGIDVTDAEIQRIIKYVEPTQISQIFGKADDSFGVIKAWIEEQSKARPSASCREMLREQLKPIGMQDLIPLEIKEVIYLVELADIAFRLLMTDVFPLGRALDISGGKMKSYHRTPMDESNLSKGTLKLLVKFCEGRRFVRSELCSALPRVDGWKEISQLLKYGYEVSRTDLLAVNHGDGGKKEKCAKIRENLKIFTSTDNTVDMLQDWRNMIQLPTYNPRTVLADAVSKVIGKSRALDILSGEFRRDGNQSENFISYIRDSILYTQGSRVANILGVGHSSSECLKQTLKQVCNIYQDSLKAHPLNDDARGTLCRRLSQRGFKSFSSKLLDEELQESQIRDVLERMEEAIENDVATRLAEILGVELDSQSTPYVIMDILEKWNEKIRKKPLAHQERIDLSNNLFREGYMEFSLEIMIGFVPKPMETAKKETTVGGKIKEAATQSAKHIIQATLNTTGLATSEIIPSFV